MAKKNLIALNEAELEIVCGGFASGSKETDPKGGSQGDVAPNPPDDRPYPQSAI